MATKDALTSLGVQDKANLLKKSAKTLPANASDKGFSAEQIIKSMYEPSLTNFLYMQRLITELGGIFDSLDTELGEKVDKVTGKSLISDTEITRLGGMETGAQVNVIESIKVNNVALEITGKAVNIDLSSYYTKTEIDSALGNKLDKASNTTKFDLVCFDTGGKILDSGIHRSDVIVKDIAQELESNKTFGANQYNQSYWLFFSNGLTNLASLYLDEYGKFRIYGPSIVFDGSVEPGGSSYTLGTQSAPFYNAFILKLNPNSNGYGLTLPSTASFAADVTLATANDIQDVRAVAEGKCKSYTISTADNASFNTQNASVSGVTSIKDISGNTIQLSSLKNGDVVIVVETDIPDRWFSVSDSKFYILETAKVDLTPYVQKSRTIAGLALTGDITKAAMQAALDMDYSLSSAELEDIFTDPVEEEEEENE